MTPQSVGESIAAALQSTGRRLNAIDPRRESWIIALGASAVAALFILLLVAPGRTLSNVYAHDIMIFFDGAHRTIGGQLPNREFHTPLGLLAYLLPAFGLWAGGSLGGMMPIATAAMLAIFLPLLIYVCVTRLPLVFSTLLALFTLGLVATPANIGEAIPSFAMFYNRWGYAILAILFLLVVPPKSGRPANLLDALVAAITLLLTFYLKISYFGVALGFTSLLLLFNEWRRLALRALIAAALGVSVVHLLWGGTGAYLADIGMAAQVNGAVRASPLGLIRMALANAAMLVPFAIILVLAAAQGVRLPTLFVALAMAGAGLLLFNQNFQGPGLMTLVPAAIVLALSLRRQSSDPAARNSHALAALALTAALALPTAVLAGESLLFHAVFAARGGDAREYVAEVDGFISQEGGRPDEGEAGLETTRLIYRQGSADLQLLKGLRTQALRQVLAQPEYLWTLQDGLGLLRRESRLSGPIMTLDMANPFNALTDRAAPKGVDSWYHAGRSFSSAAYRPAGEIFREVAVIMVPKAPAQPSSHSLLEKLYGGYIARHYDLVAESDYWYAYKEKARGRLG